MIKKSVKHAIAIVLLAGFVALALGSGSSPSSSSSYSSGGGSSSSSSGGGGGSTVTVFVENRSSHPVNVVFSPDYKAHLIVSGGSKSISVPIGASMSHDNNYLVRYETNADSTRFTFFDR